jgi:hypothetical protein
MNRNKFFASETQWPLIKWDSHSPPIIGESSVDFLQLVRVQETPGEAGTARAGGRDWEITPLLLSKIMLELSPILRFWRKFFSDFFDFRRSPPSAFSASRRPCGEGLVNFLQLIRVREKLGESPACELLVI